MSTFDDHFGVCPDCGKHDGYINIGKGHWFYCREHRVKWCAGSGLFSAWREQTEDEQRAEYDDLAFGEYRDIKARDACMTNEPTDDQIDALLERIEALALAALIDHPQRERVVEILAAGGHLFARRDDTHVDFFVGWFADPALRPPDADPHEVVKLLRAPRRVLLGGASGRGDS